MQKQIRCLCDHLCWQIGPKRRKCDVQLRLTDGWLIVYRLSAMTTANSNLWFRWPNKRTNLLQVRIECMPIGVTKTSWHKIFAVFDDVQHHKNKRCVLLEWLRAKVLRQHLRFSNIMPSLSKMKKKIFVKNYLSLFKVEYTWTKSMPPIIRSGGKIYMSPPDMEQATTRLSTSWCSWPLCYADDSQAEF